MVKEQILDTIKKHRLIEPGQHIIIGLSGGPDSVCLFDVLLSLKEEMNLSLHPVHINHKLRPKAAEADQIYVEALCRRAGCPCKTFICDCNAVAKKEKMTGEEAGRKVRYEAFSQVARELEDQGIDRDQICIAVAHNAEDQAETVLFRFLRGSGTDGLAGIRYERKDSRGIRVVRPLLDVKREQILDYCTDRGLAPRMDHTNQEPVYTRNKLRLTLIPALEREYNPALKETLHRTAKACGDDSDYLREQAVAAFEEMIISSGEDSLLLQGARLRSCHRAIRRRVILLAFSKLGMSEEFTAAHFESCEKIVFHQGPSAYCNLPKGFYLMRIYDDIKVGRQVQALASHNGLRLAVSVLDGRDFHLEDGEDKERRKKAVFDYDLLKESFGPDAEKRIRMDFRRPGDYFFIGQTQRKKIQDYFVDVKIPKGERDKIPLIKIGQEVLWIPSKDGAGRYTTKYKLSPNTKKVICIEIICEI